MKFLKNLHLKNIFTILGEGYNKTADFLSKFLGEAQQFGRPLEVGIAVGTE